MVTIALSIRNANSGGYILSFIKRVIFHLPISMTVAVAPILRAPAMLQATQSSPSPIVCLVWTWVEGDSPERGSSWAGLRVREPRGAWP